MKLSNSAITLYEQCPRKYYYRYVENLKGNYTSSALLFGVALDVSLNYILQSIHEKKEWTREQAIATFGESLEKWNGENRLDFFKGDVPKELQDNIQEDSIDFQEQIWEEMYKRGINCIDVYIKEILPQFKEIVSVQEKFEIKNEDDDIFNGILDFIAKTHDDKIVLFDNKSASAKYPKNSVIKSQQLSLYLGQFPNIKHAGYVVLIKNPEREKGLTHQIIIDEIPEQTTQESYQKLEDTINNIKEKKFPTNFKSCRLFNKPCEYATLCKYGDPIGLIPAKEKK